MSRDPIRIGVVGSGFGLALASTLASMERYRVVGLVDRNADRNVEAIATRFGATGYRDIDSMLDGQRPDAVVLAVPPHGREAALDLLLCQNIPVFLEKPLAGTLVAARGLIEIAKRHDTLVMMGFSFRFQPVVVKARELLSGPLGNVLLAQGDYVFDWPAPADGWLWDRNRGGGLLTENSCHLFDIISHLMGRPLGVTAHGATMAGAPGPNAINLILDFANGSSAGLMLGTVGARASSPSPHLQIYTEHGHLTLSGRDHIWVGLQYGRRDDTGANVFLDDPEKLSRTRYSAALDHFADCITTGSPTTATLEDGLWSVELADAAYRSMEIGARVVLGGTLT